MKPRVVIGLQGGLVQGATANMDIDILVMDYDIEGADPDKLSVNLEGSECFAHDVGPLVVSEEEMDKWMTLKGVDDERRA